MNSPLKDSGVEWLGRIPAHWEIRRLALCFREVARPGREDLPVLSISIHDGISDDELDADERKRKVTHIEDRSKYKRVLPGDLAYNMMRAWQGGLGAVNVEGQVSPAYVVAEPKVPLNTHYVELLLRTPMAIEEMRRFSRGIADFRSRLYWEYFRDLKICLPPVEEQESILLGITRATDRIGRLVAKKARFIQVLIDKRVSLIVHAVTKGLNPMAPMKDSGITWIRETPTHWAVTKLNHRFSIQLGKMLDEKKRTMLHPFPYLRNQDVQWAGINTIELPEMDIPPEERERYTAVHGDLLVCEGGEVGRAAIWQGGRIGFQKALHRLRPRGLDLPEFMRYVLMAASASGAFEQYDTKSTISHLPADKFRTFKFAFPPVSEQRAIVAHLDRATTRIGALIAKTERSMDLLREHRTALITAAVTGNIDLREAA